MTTEQYIIAMIMIIALTVLVIILGVYAYWITGLHKRKREALQKVLGVMSEKHLSRLTISECQRIIINALRDEQDPII